MSEQLKGATVNLSVDQRFTQKNNLAAEITALDKNFDTLQGAQSVIAELLIEENWGLIEERQQRLIELVVQAK
ncbi:MAG: hypothetical protein COB04_15485 [Gammaproteobacteria bacterium]|nr:MAG: hypothetical protein COB04_15485 [Gammaproteobacteria bacterium]